jgi:hydrogenase maturation protease
MIGCGNALAGDDSFGVELVERLRQRGETNCALLDLPHAGPELLELFEQADVILFADAITSGWPPGTLHLVPLPWPGLESRGLAAVSSHGWSLIETTRLAEALGRRPPRLLLLGVEMEDVAPGAPRSAGVERALELAVEVFPRVRALLENEHASVWRWPRHFPPEKSGFPGEP